MGIEDDAYASYCLDEAVLAFCSGVEKKIDDVPTPKGRKGEERRHANQEALLREILQLPEEEKPASQFKDPAAMFSK